MSRSRAALLTALAVGGALVSAPAARAESGYWGVLCAVSTVEQQTVTGQSWEGTVTAGPVVFEGLTGTVRCFVTVDGVEVSSSPAGAGAVVTVAGRTSYVADGASHVEICTEVTAGQGSEIDCDDTFTASVPLPGGVGQRSRGNGKGQQGGGKNKNRDGTVTDPTPSGDADVPPLADYYPSGTIEISSNGTGVTYAYRSFDPPLQTWTCPVPAGPSVSCTPPAPPVGYRNTCGQLDVAATSVGPGTVNGTSGCAAAVATATSSGPTATASSGSVRAEGEFPWTCAAAPADSAVWTVTCTVGP